MSTGDRWKDDGLSTLEESIARSLNCRIGKTFVAELNSKKFRLPTSVRVRLLGRRSSSELGTTSGEVAAFLMSWDMPLARRWECLMVVRRSSTPTQRDVSNEELSCWNCSLGCSCTYGVS
jgi:hypothetical protein